MQKQTNRQTRTAAGNDGGEEKERAAYGRREGGRQFLFLPFRDAVLLRHDGVCQLLGEIVELGQPVQVEVRVV